MRGVEVNHKRNTISIRHPQLVRIRNTLREALHEVFLLEMGIFRKRQSGLHYIEDMKQIKHLNSEENNLRLAWKKSICTCSLCGSRESNMIYNSNEDYWFCVMCYEQRHDFYQQKAKEGQVWYDGGGRPSTTWFP